MPVKKILPAAQRTAGRSLFRGSGSYHQSRERIEIERGLQREVDGVADHARELAHLLVDVARCDKKRSLTPLAELRRDIRACVLQKIRGERRRLNDRRHPQRNDRHAERFAREGEAVVPNA